MTYTLYKERYDTFPGMFQVYKRDLDWSEASELVRDIKKMFLEKHNHVMQSEWFIKSDADGRIYYLHQRNK